MGRHTSYDPKYVQTALTAGMLGADDRQLAEMIGVTQRTLDRWKRKYPAFLSALKTAKGTADSNVVMSLYKRATGFDHTVVKLFLAQGKVIEHQVTERVIGDVTAQIYWLKNRQPKQWRDRPLMANETEIDESLKELLRAIRDSPRPNGVHPDDVPVPASS